MTKPIVALSAREMVRAMQTGALSAAETMAAHFEMIEAREPSIRAWAFLEQGRRDGGRGQGGRGSAIRLKPWPASWPARRGQGHHRHRRHADRVSARGFMLAGAPPRTRPSSLACARPARSSWARSSPPNTRSSCPGPTRNPHDLSRSPGGSSMGSAAAVAAHMAPVALATQTKGSIIRPASFCGVVGYKPSLGLLPRTGILRQSHAARSAGSHGARRRRCGLSDRRDFRPR